MCYEVESYTLLALWTFPVKPSYKKSASLADIFLARLARCCTKSCTYLVSLALKMMLFLQVSPGLLCLTFYLLCFWALLKIFAYFDQYYAHEYCNYATVCIWFVTAPAKRDQVGTKYTFSQNHKYLKFCV